MQTKAGRAHREKKKPRQKEFRYRKGARDSHPVGAGTMEKRPKACSDKMQEGQDLRGLGILY